MRKILILSIGFYILSISFLLILGYKNNQKSLIKIDDLENKLWQCNEIAEERMYHIEYLQEQLFNYENIEVEATVYNAVSNQCNDDVIHTASMFKLDLNNPYKHRIIAVSRDLLKLFPFGTKVRIIGTDYDGEWIVNDLMNKRFTNRIDLLINKNMSIGKWNNVQVCIMK